MIEFESSTMESFNELQPLEELLRSGFGDDPDVLVDGHDFGTGIFNIFIHTNTPEPTFEKTLAIIEGARPGAELRAGYRDFNEDDYVPLHPQSLESFELR
ncbi:ABC transporter [Bryocella elongata]|uniref:ABC transporter n=1 Tax=Bryocella elongata TaxID=863522 RepID=UPI0011B0E614|nr:ABC transporter [Bryocella elongata]